MSKYLKCTTNKSPMSYKCGEKMIFKIEAKNNCQKEQYGYIKWKLETDDGKKEEGLFKFDNFKPLFLETSLSRPGFAHLSATVYNKDAAVDAAFDTLDAGAGAEVEKLEYLDTIPEDFDKYWADIEEMVAKHTPEVVYEREITENVPKGFRVYDIRVSVPCEGRAASGIISFPEKEGKYPICVAYQGYSVVGSSVDCRENTITFRINAHGIENDISGIEAQLRYPELNYYGFDRNDNSSNMTTYWRNMMIRDLVALKYAKTHPMWDGKGITATGGSQGALQATTVAAHDRDVTFLDIQIPWFCNLKAEKNGYLGGWRPQPDEGVRYFDTVAQATRVKCPVFISMRLGDYVCPPSTTTTLYNSFKGIKALDAIQSGTHPYAPPEPETVRLRYDPANPTGEFKLGKYRHYKGGEYEVVSLATDSENLEDTVIYKSAKDGRIWVRPRWMFEEYVNINGIATKRFEYVG